METDFEILGERCSREGDQAILFRERHRKMALDCSISFSKIEFCYHHINTWEHPWEIEPVTETDRVRLATMIANHYTPK
jgi:hypothetical protein